MKIKATLFALLLPTILMAQKPVELKSKYFGKYNGEISAFELDAGKELIDIEATSITVEIKKSEVTFTIGRNVLQGTYKVLFEAKKYYLLDCTMENQLAGERIVVYKKGSKISRDGLYPQPNAFLYKD